MWKIPSSTKQLFATKGSDTSPKVSNKILNHLNHLRATLSLSPSSILKDQQRNSAQTNLQEALNRKLETIVETNLRHFVHFVFHC